MVFNGVCEAVYSDSSMIEDDCGDEDYEYEDDQDDSEDEYELEEDEQLEMTCVATRMSKWFRLVFFLQSFFELNISFSCLVNLICRNKYILPQHLRNNEKFEQFKKYK